MPNLAAFMFARRLKQILPQAIPIISRIGSKKIISFLLYLKQQTQGTFLTEYKSKSFSNSSFTGDLFKHH
jgi:hypothetical protein